METSAERGLIKVTEKKGKGFYFFFGFSSSASSMQHAWQLPMPNIPTPARMKAAVHQLIPQKGQMPKSPSRKRMPTMKTTAPSHFEHLQHIDTTPLGVKASLEG
jgi:hypothetical protein